MKKFRILLFFFFCTMMLNAQNQEQVQYVVKKGDTLYSLSQKYGVTVDHILEHNSYLKFEYLGIGDVLRFPLELTPKRVTPTETYDPYERAGAYQTDLVRHVVNDEETLYALSRKYQVPVKSILAHNPTVEQSVIKVGDTVFIPLNVTINEGGDSQKTTTVEGKFSHVIDLGETLYGISKRYGISVEDLLAMNPSLNQNAIGIGDTVLVDGRRTRPVQVKARSTVNSYNEPIVHNTLNNPYVEPGDILHKVQAQETLYSLHKKYGVEIAQLVRWNGLQDHVLPNGYDLIVAKADMPNLPVLSASTPNARVYGTQERVTEVYTQESTHIETHTERPTHTETHIETHTYTGRNTGQASSEVPYMENPNAHLHDHGDLRHSHVGAEVPHEHENTEIVTEGETYFDRKDGDIPSTVSTKEPAITEEYTPIHQIDYSKLKPIKHNVSSGETFEMIASQYNQNLDLMKDWNKIDDIYTPLPKELIVGWYIPKERPNSVRPVLSVSQQESEFRESYNRYNRNQISYKRMKERGKGTWLRDDASLDKNFYCLHRTAPMKSIIRVVNPMNDKVVYVKVVGRPPVDGKDGDVNIKLTYAAVKKLNLLDEKFVLDWSYHTPKGK